MKKKRAFTLLEVLISLALFAFAFSSLFFWYSRLSSEKSKEERVQKKIALEKDFHRQLLKILPKATGDLFYTMQNQQAKGSSLVFTFDHGPNREPLLSDRVLGRLYLDEHSNTLYCGIWPWVKDEMLFEPSLRVTLLEGVEDIQFSFYYPPDPFKQPVDPERVAEPRPQESWQKEWNGEYHLLPALVRITIKKEGDEKTFGYCLDPKLYSVVYIKPQKEEKN